MLKPIIAALVVAALAGCISIEVNEAHSNLPAGGSQSCDASSYQYLVGQNEADIDRSHLPHTFRIICASCMVTMDHNPNRLNVQLGVDGKVGSIRCG